MFSQVSKVKFPAIVAVLNAGIEEQGPTNWAFLLFPEDLTLPRLF